MSAYRESQYIDKMLEFLSGKKTEETRKMSIYDVVVCVKVQGSTFYRKEFFNIAPEEMIGDNVLWYDNDWKLILDPWWFEDEYQEMINKNKKQTI